MPRCTSIRMLCSGFLPLQFRTSGPCLCPEERMEEREEKPPGPLKACTQVSELPFLGDPELAPTQATRPNPLGPGGCPSCLFSVWSHLVPPNQQASNKHCAFNASPHLFNPDDALWGEFGILHQKARGYRFLLGQQLMASLESKQLQSKIENMQCEIRSH